MAAIHSRLHRWAPLLLGVPLLFLSPMAGGLETRSYVLTEVFGQDVWTGFCNALRSDAGEVEVSYENPLEKHRITAGPDMGTLTWAWTSLSRNATASAELREGKIVVTGVMKGKDRSGKHALDGLPWYQLPDFAFMRIATLAKDSVEYFWIVAPDDLTFRKMKVRNAGLETLPIGPKAVPAVRVVLSAAGFPEWMWKNEYWYTPNGDYLGFRGRRGGPVAPYGTIVIQGY